MEIELNEKKYDKSYGVQPDSYKATLIDIGDPYLSDPYEGETKIEKVRLVFHVEVEDQNVIVFEGEKCPDCGHRLKLTKLSERHWCEKCWEYKNISLLSQAEKIIGKVR